MEVVGEEKGEKAALGCGDPRVEGGDPMGTPHPSAVEIRCADNLIALPAQGQGWPMSYSLRAGDLHRLPKRLRATVEFAAWDTAFMIGNYRYNNVTTLDLLEDPNTPREDRKHE